MKGADLKGTLTVCLTNWRRPELLRRLLPRLAANKLEPRLFVWNNGEPADFPEAHWTVASSVNMICWPRWFMATCAETEYVCIIDDDIDVIHQDSLEVLVAEVAGSPPGTIAGVEGVVLSPAGGYRDGTHRRMGDHRPTSVPCDVVKGEVMAMRTADLRRRLPLSDPARYREDDIAVSALLAEGQRDRHRCIANPWRYFRVYDAPHALCEQPGHSDRRDAAALSWFGAQPMPHPTVVAA
ncbi:hypothetical protein [Azospirillum sp. sgz302134]